VIRGTATLGVLGVLACASGTQATPARPGPVAPGEAPGAVAPSEGRGREIEYSVIPGARYRLERFDTVLVQLPDSSTQSQIFARTAWLTVQTAEAGEGFDATIVLDSLEVSGVLAQNAAAALDSARGTRWTAHVGGNGRLSRLAADRSSVVGDQAGALLQLLFPILPGEGIRAGAAWTDTSDAATKVDMFDVREQAVTQYLAMSPSVRGGGTALPIQADASFSQEGTSSQRGQNLSIESNGTRRFIYYLGLDGVPAGLEGSEKSDVTIMVPAVGQSMQATRSAAVRITPLPAR
jgi:hypothetical protein